MTVKKYRRREMKRTGGCINEGKSGNKERRQIKTD